MRASALLHELAFCDNGRITNRLAERAFPAVHLRSISFGPRLFGEMQGLLEKIEANAAARLPLPAGRQPAQELARYKGFLKIETHRLKMLHRAGAGGLEICQARAEILDLLLRYLWQTAKGSLSAQAQKEFPAIALVAIGGYGRAELNPHSDIDFMFLHNRQIAGGTRPG